MTSPAPALPGNSACPRCGAGFRCGMVEPSGALIDCWCLQQPRALPVPRAGPAFLPKVPAPRGLLQPLTAPLPAVPLPAVPLPAAPLHASLTAAFARLVAQRDRARPRPTRNSRLLLPRLP